MAADSKKTSSTSTNNTRKPKQRRRTGPATVTVRRIKPLMTRWSIQKVLERERRPFAMAKGRFFDELSPEEKLEAAAEQEKEEDEFQAFRAKVRAEFLATPPDSSRTPSPKSSGWRSLWEWQSAEKSWIRGSRLVADSSSRGRILIV